MGGGLQLALTSASHVDFQFPLAADRWFPDFVAVGAQIRPNEGDFGGVALCLLVVLLRLSRCLEETSEVCELKGISFVGQEFVPT